MSNDTHFENNTPLRQKHPFGDTNFPSSGGCLDRGHPLQVFREILYTLQGSKKGCFCLQKGGTNVLEGGNKNGT